MYQIDQAHISIPLIYNGFYIRPFAQLKKWKYMYEKWKYMYECYALTPIFIGNPSNP